MEERGCKDSLAISVASNARFKCWGLTRAGQLLHIGQLSGGSSASLCISAEDEDRGQLVHGLSEGKVSFQISRV